MRRHEHVDKINRTAPTAFSVKAIERGDFATPTQSMKLHLRLLIELIGFLRWGFGGMLVLMVVVGLTEGLSITLLLPLLSHIGISYSAEQGFAGTMLSRGL